MAAFVVAALLLWFRQPLAEWLWPQTRAERLREQAGQALAAGRLTAPDGSGARELYEAALALDPDRADARAGLSRVGQAALAQARTAIDRRQYAQARQWLVLAEQMAIPRAQIEQTRERLRRHEAATTGIDRLLEQATAARAERRLDGAPDAALPLYQRVLELQPDQVEALEGREDTLSDLLQQAQGELARDHLPAAASLVRRVQAADAGHVELPGALAALNRAADARRGRADRQLRAGRLELALQGYREVLQILPEDGKAESGVVAVAAAHAARSERHAADFRFREAERELSVASAVAREADVEVPAIAQAREHLQRARLSQRQTTVRLAPAERRRRVTRLLAESAQARDRGDLLTPPGESAYDKLRSAQALAPADRRVKTALAELAGTSRSCFREALEDNRLIRAGACLDVLKALDEDSAAVGEGRRRLAQQWIALGDQRLSAGEIQGASDALAKARSLDPHAAGLSDFAERVRVASAAPVDPPR